MRPGNAVVHGEGPLRDTGHTCCRPEAPPLPPPLQALSQPRSPATAPPLTLPWGPTSSKSHPPTPPQRLVPPTTTHTGSPASAPRSQEGLCPPPRGPLQVQSLVGTDRGKKSLSLLISRPPLLSPVLSKRREEVGERNLEGKKEGRGHHTRWGPTSGPAAQPPASDLSPCQPSPWGSLASQSGLGGPLHMPRGPGSGRAPWHPSDPPRDTWGAGNLPKNPIPPSVGSKPLYTQPDGKSWPPRAFGLGMCLGLTEGAVTNTVSPECRVPGPGTPFLHVTGQQTRVGPCPVRCQGHQDAHHKAITACVWAGLQLPGGLGGGRPQAAHIPGPATGGPLTSSKISR